MANKNKSFIISVVPLVRISLNRDQFFYYLYNKKIPSGSLVSIFLGRRKIEGVVISSKSDFKRLGNIQLKKIDSVIKESFLTSEQLKLAEFISDYYIVSLGIVLKSFTPKRVGGRSIKHATYNIKHNKINLTNEQKGAVKLILKRAKSYYLYSSERTAIYIKAILEIKKRDLKSQFLILLPELTLISPTVEIYKNYFKESEIAILTGKVSKGQFYQNWKKIKSGEAKIIIGTRQAIFAPFKNLKLISAEEEQDISFKQWDMSPRYDARTVAEKLATIHSAKIIFASTTPRIEAYYKALNGKCKLLRLSNLQNLKNKNSSKVARYKLRDISCEIVDMRKEKWIKNYSPISKDLKSEIQYALKHKLQIILFINRQGMSAFSVCQNCKTVLKCPKCDRALVYQKGGNYKCLHCNYKSSIFPKCPKCQGMDFKNVGLGTQKVEAEIKKLFPSAKIARADFETMKKTKAQEDLYRKFSKNKVSILVGTQMITKSWNLQNVGLIGIIDADNLLSIPDFRTNEKAFQNLVQVSGRTGCLSNKSRGKIIIQTYEPENFVIKTASEMNFEKFYQREIKERKSLNYPPFSQLIKIIFQDTNKEKVKKETQKIYQELHQKTKSMRNIQIIAPHSPLVSKIRGRFKKQIIIKIKTKKIPTKIRKILTRLGTGWIIDVDPINIV